MNKQTLVGSASTALVGRRLAGGSLPAAKWPTHIRGMPSKWVSARRASSAASAAFSLGKDSPLASHFRFPTFRSAGCRTHAEERAFSAAAAAAAASGPLAPPSAKGLTAREQTSALAISPHFRAAHIRGRHLWPLLAPLGFTAPRNWQRKARFSRTMLPSEAAFAVKLTMLIPRERARTERIWR